MDFVLILEIQEIPEIPEIWEIPEIRENPEIREISDVRDLQNGQEIQNRQNPVYIQDVLDIKIGRGDAEGGGGSGWPCQ